jgi:hypothetical protein
LAWRSRRQANTTGSGAKDLDFGFGCLPALSKMGEIQEFQCFSVI